MFLEYGRSNSVQQNKSIFLGMLGNAGAIDDRQDNECDSGLNENHRTRQLLKVLAISDVVIYRTRAERLHTDLFYFMGDASKAYNEHFSAELQKVNIFFTFHVKKCMLYILISPVNL